MKQYGYTMRQDNRGTRMRSNHNQSTSAVAAKSAAAAARIAVLTLSLTLALAACDRSAGQSGAEGETAAAAVVAPSPSAPLPSTASAGALLAPATAEAAPPENGAALSAVYGGNDAGATEYALADGRYVGFWHGYAYRSGDDERYTAFVHAAAPSGNGIAAPGQQVELAQLTYTLRDGAWEAGKPQTGVGRFGGLGQPPQFDADRLTLTYPVSPQRALLALPSVVAATGGVQIQAYEVFLLDGRGDWRHAGTLPSGADYSASCKNGPSTPDTECERNVGRLRFDATAEGAMPVVTINFSGSVRDDSGAIRASGPDDAKTYRYDEATASYGESAAQ